MNDMWMISDGVYKMIINANEKEELYQLTADTYENSIFLNGELTPTEEGAKTNLEKAFLEIRN